MSAPIGNKNSIPPIRLGLAGPQRVSQLGLGCMAMSSMYGEADVAKCVATIHAALDAGITMIDTGDFYGSGDNEMLIGQALKHRRSDALLSVKFGALRTPDGGWSGVDGRPVAVKNFLTYSLKRLGTDHIDIYRLARLDATVPIEDTIGAMAEMVRAGYVRYIGLSEVGIETIRRAHAVHPVCDLQIEYSLISRGPEEKIFPVLRELGIGVTAYGVLSRGLLAGSQPLGKHDLRAHMPRFAEENATQNRALFGVFQALSRELQVTPVQLAIGWVLAKAKRASLDLVALTGARTLEQLEASISALAVTLDDDAIRRIEQAIPIGSAAGSRYAPAQMAHLDSEK